MREKYLILLHYFNNSFRLDRLLILLDTGSSTSVRTTAAKQLAQIAAKSVRSDVGSGDEVTKLRLVSSYIDQSQWKELMSVVARVRKVFTSNL